MSEIIRYGFHGISRTARCPFCGATFKYDNRDIYSYTYYTNDYDENRERLLCPDCGKWMRLLSDGSCDRNTSCMPE